MSSSSFRFGGLSRRQWVLGGLSFGLSVSCGPRKGTGYPGYALIATAGQRSVAAVDLTAFRLEKSISVPGEPSSILSTRDGGAFVLLGDTGSVAYVGQGLTVERSRRVADSLSALRHMPDGKHLVAIEPQSHNLLYLDAATFKVTQRRRLHETPNAIDVSHDGELIVCTSENGAVNLLNPSTGEWRHAELKPPLSAVLFRYDGKMILTANPDQRILTALRVPDLAVIAELPLAMRPDNLCFTPDGGQLFVSGEGMDAVAIVFPYDALDVDQTVLVGREPGAMACSDSPAYLFVGSSHETNVSIMRVDTRKPVGAVDVGCRPTYLTLTPDGQYALVLCQDSGYLAVIRVGAIRAMRSKMGVALFTMLPVGEKPRQCAFVPKQLA